MTQTFLAIAAGATMLGFAIALNLWMEVGRLQKLLERAENEIAFLQEKLERTRSPRPMPRKKDASR